MNQWSKAVSTYIQCMLMLKCYLRLHGVRFDTVSVKIYFPLFLNYFTLFTLYSVLKEEDEEDEDNQPENDIPPHFLTIPDLPPSLLPPPPGGWKVKVRTEWG